MSFKFWAKHRFGTLIKRKKVNHFMDNSNQFKFIERLSIFWTHDLSLDNVSQAYWIPFYPRVSLGSAQIWEQHFRGEFQVTFWFLTLGTVFEKVADSLAVFMEYMWTKGQATARKLRIEKFPDTCGRRLSPSVRFNTSRIYVMSMQNASSIQF